MSCKNNSVISANFVSSDTASNGRRLSFQQRTDSRWDSSIGVGNVIRFDVDQNKFVKSVADPYFYGSLDLSNAEVVGIVEAINQTSGITYATIVIHGLMNYPGLTGDVNNGNDGGADVYFLSSKVPGGITFSVEEERGFIAKPVLQYCPVSGSFYNSIVINYLGYETSSSETASVLMSQSNVGEIKIVDENSEIPEGWVESGVSSLLSVSEYQDAYKIYGTNYGSYEELTINESESFISSLLNKSIRPVDPITGKGIGTYFNVISTDAFNKKIVVEHTSKQDILHKSIYSSYQISGDTTKISILNSSITHFRTPKIETNIRANVNLPTELLSFNTKTLLRVKPNTVVSYLPQEIQFKDVTITGTLGTVNITDIDFKIVSLESRIAVLEQKLGI